MRRLLVTAGLIALAVGLLWIGQGTGTVAWPQIELHGQPAAMGRLWRSLAAVGLVLIWQSNQ